MSQIRILFLLVAMLGLNIYAYARVDPVRVPLTPYRTLGETPQNTIFVVLHGVERGSQSEAEALKLPKLDPVKFEQFIQGKNVKVLTDQTIAASVKRGELVREKNIRDIKAVYQSRPDLLAHYLKDSSDPSATVFQFVDRDGELDEVELVNNDAMIYDALVVRRMLQSPQNQARIYSTLYEKLEQRLGSRFNQTKAQSLPDPSAVAGGTISQINKAIGLLVQTWFELIPNRLSYGKPSSYPPSCGSEIGAGDDDGAGNGGDRNAKCAYKRKGYTCGIPNPNGLLAKCDWPLKNYNTCVKRQGHRGTCSAFAITAAVESAIAVKYNRWVNLSEQDLYKHEKLDWALPWDDYYGDPYSLSDSVFRALATGYRFPYERDWDYNPSCERTKNDDTRKYHKSCEDYNDPNCSNTNHQSRKSCYQDETDVVKKVVKETCEFVEGIPLVGTVGGWVCKKVTDWVEDTEITTVCMYNTSIPPNSGYKIQGMAVAIYDPLVEWEQGLALVKVNLSAMIPIVINFHSVPSYRKATANGGFVPYEGKNEEPKPTGHNVLLTGYVDNEDLPDGIEPGDGGGYFIIKDSKGCKFGDEGYVYLPYSWVKQWTKQMVSVPGVTQN